MNFRSVSGQFPVSESVILVTHTLEIGKIGIDDDKECNCFARCIFLSQWFQCTKYINLTDWVAVEVNRTVDTSWATKKKQNGPFDKIINSYHLREWYASLGLKISSKMIYNFSQTDPIYEMTSSTKQKCLFSWLNSQIMLWCLSTTSDTLQVNLSIPSSMGHRLWLIVYES